MKKNHNLVWLLATIVFAVCLTAYALSYLVTEPWHMLPDIGGDGAKNNLTYLYQCMYGKGYWFEGMNYPYGEHIVYTDGQPLLSVLFTHMHHVTPGMALSVCWLLVGLSYVLSVVYTYLTLVHFKVGRLAAMLFAGLIVLGTPQLIRLQAHYALSYVCLAPMLFYWTIQYHEGGRQWRYSAYVFLLGCVLSFLHPYFAALILIWVGCYSLVYFLLAKTTVAARLKHVAPILVSTIAVFSIVAAVMKLTDPITDRPGAPLMTFDTCTHLKEIFTSFMSPVWQWVLKRKYIKTIAFGGEGYTYLGLVTILTIFFFILYFVWRSVKDPKMADACMPRIWLLMMAGLLLFSMGAPFIWHMEWLLKYVSAFRQFRSLGRFSWLFYQIAVVYSVVIIYRAFAWLADHGRKPGGYALLSGAMGLWAYEASGDVAFTHILAVNAAYNYDMIFSKSEQPWESYLADHHLHKEDFQGIILLPFFHIGTEKLWVGDAGWMLTLGSKAALQLHLPIVDVMMSRSSWSQAEKQVRLIGGPYTDKPLLRDTHSNKPFLLLRADDANLDPDQRYLLAASDSLGRKAECYVFVCYPDRIRANDQKMADSVNRVLPFVHVGDTCIAGEGTWFIDHTDTGSAPKHFFGAGAALPIHEDERVWTTIAVRPVADSQQYEL